MITVNTKLGELYNLKEFDKVKDCIVSSSENFLLGKHENISIADLNDKEQSTWFKDDMVIGLNRLEEIATSNIDYVFNIYSQQECDEALDKKTAKLVYFPAINKTSDKLIILASGGAYGSVCNLAEAFPVAAKLNSLGYSCFCLCYRVVTKKTFNQGLMPKPIEDVAQSLKFIANHNDIFNVNVNDYTLIGFSAGGHVVSAFATKNVGYEKYNVIKPSKVILVYPLIDITAIKGIMKMFFTIGLFGKKHKKRDIKDYSVNFNVDKDYPKTYLIQSINDSTIDINVTRKFEQTLNDNNVEVKTNFFDDSNHGFGLGSNTKSGNWVEEALKF